MHPDLNPLRLLMQTPLPNRSVQRRRLYRPDLAEIYAVYDLINEFVFDHALVRPEIQLRNSRKFLGQCVGTENNCRIVLNDRWYCVQWMVITLAHEMAHQYQWDVIGNERLTQGKRRKMGHHNTFYIHKPRMAEYGIMLKRHINHDAWLEHLDFTRC